MRPLALVGLLATTALGGLGMAPVPSGLPTPDCGPAMEIVVPVVGEPLCSHGDDPHLAPGNAAASSNRADSPVPSVPVPCVGNGADGARVEVLGIRAKGGRGVTSGDARRWVGQVEWTVSESAAQWGATRHVRWVTETGSDGSCRPAIRDVVLDREDLEDFGRMVSALRIRGYDRPDRKYLVLADDDTYCGLASAPRDDRKTMSNRADHRAGYARVDRPCWAGGDMGFSSVAAHELLHTLGAVQDSAPNAHGTAHCRDEWDVLCYADGGGTMSLRCTDDRSSTSGAGDHHNRLLDCNGDDYFRPDPPAGSYLATHWNVADSRFLWDGRSAPSPRTPADRRERSKGSSGCRGLLPTAVPETVRSLVGCPVTGR